MGRPTRDMPRPTYFGPNIGRLRCNGLSFFLVAARVLAMTLASDNAVLSLDAHAARAAEQALERIATARAMIGTVIFGQDKVVEEVLVSLLSGGHGLLVGVP